MTRRCLLAPQTWAYGATIDATSEHPQHPATKMLKDQPRERYQADSGVRSITIDVTQSQELPISVVAPLFTNINNENASWRVRIAHAGEIDTNPWADSARIFGGTGQRIRAVPAPASRGRAHRLDEHGCDDGQLYDRGAGACVSHGLRLRDFQTADGFG